ncbi:MAG: transporter substrate-binding domain-containing protein [Ruminococcus sp.]|nr:transporter substrate-binding domain-containing protein [Ruminococcus sp.]
MQTGYKAYLKLMIAFMICMNFIATGCITVSATEETDNRTVRAGIFDFEGYHMKDEEGKLTGYGIEFLNLISEYSHLNFEYTGYDRSWNDMQSMLENGEIDVVTSARRTAEREEKFDFSYPIGRNSTILSVKLDNMKIHSTDYRTYDGMVIGLLKGSSQNDSLANFAEKRGFLYTAKEYDNADTLASALQTGEVDAILSSNLRKAENEKTLDVIEEDNFYAIVRKGDTELLDEINYAIEQMDLNEGDWKNLLFYQNYGPVYSSELTFTERELEYINKIASGEKQITITALGNREPYSYVENGELKGILPDYFRYVMEIAGLPYEVVVPESKEDYYNTADTNSVDIVIDNIKPVPVMENSEYRGFNTDPYLTTGISRVTRKDFVGDIRKVAVADSQSREFIVNVLDDVDFVNYPTREEAMQAVLDKKADAAYVYAYAARLFVNNDKTHSLYYSVTNNMNIDFRMYIRNSTDHELVTILNKCIQQIPSEMMNQLVSNYTTYTVDDIDFFEYLKSNPTMMLAIEFVIVLISGVVLILYLKGRWNVRLLNATEQANKEMSEQLAIVEALSHDYTNVYAVNDKAGTARIVKLEGYVVEGLKKDSGEEHPYMPILQHYIDTRVHEDDREYLTEALSLDSVRKHLTENTEYNGSYRIKADGEEHHFQYTYVKVKDSSDENVILAGFRNIDDMIQREQEQNEILSEALAQAQYANNAKTTFLNNMSHDIRTPMNAIIGFTSLAVTHIDNKQQVQDYLGKILTSSNHLLSLINDVLDMSRIESGKVKIEEKEVSLPDIMHDLKTIVQADVKSKQLEFYIDTLDVTNEMIICDKLRLNQVLLNILSNAMKYTKPGGMVSVRVIQTAEEQDNYASYEFRVKDTGIGMSPEFLKHVFEPFEREQTATVSGIQGTGLGLAITKNIVDMMGGTILVESEEGKGSEFIVQLRFRVTETTGKSQKIEHLADLRALVVDDDVNTCVSVSKMLSAIGMHPDWTTLGKEALIRTQFAIEQNEPYSAYIIDWSMPDTNGIELVRRIRKVIGDIAPIIILTAYDWTDIEDEAREAGVTAFCSKPIFFSELREVLAKPYGDGSESEAEEVEEMRFDGKKILLVEDNELNQEIALAILENVGFVIETADDGTVAVEMIKNNPADKFDLILMDIQMPIMNGYEATKIIRELDDKEKANIPIVAMTANAFDEDRQEAINAGMNGHIAKPINIDTLMETLKDILN